MKTVQQKVMQTLFPRSYEERQQLRVAIAKSTREAQRLTRDVKRSQKLPMPAAVKL